MARDPMDLLHGTLDVLVLKSLAFGARHGYAISRWIEDRTKGVFEIEDAALYKALHRLERQGAVEADWGVSDTNRRAKYYELTKAGRELLKAEAATWHRYADAVVEVLQAAKD